MAGRIRTIKPEILEDERSAGLSDGAWRLWVSIWLLADDYGRSRAVEEWLLAQVFWARPDHSREALASLLDEIERADLVRRYTVSGQRYLEVTGWNKHQKVDHPGKPRIPPPQEVTQASREARETIAKVSTALAPDLRPVPATSEHQRSRVSAKDLQTYWLQVTGNIEPQLLEVALRIDDYVNAHGEENADAVMRRAVDAFEAWRADCPENRRPSPSPDKFCAHWSAIQDVMNGKRKLKSSATGIMAKLTAANLAARGDE